MPHLRIATRGSDLARAQAAWVATALGEAHPGLTTDLVVVTTTGDADRTSPVAALTEMGAFVRGVQYAVLDGRADIAVHSAKDLPVLGPDGLVAFHPTREAPWDVLCGATLDDLPEGAVVGTGSPRRSAQLVLLRPDLRVEGIRGNVGTRLAAVESGRVDAVVLAEAGLARLGRTGAISERLRLDAMVPAPAQAALTIEVPVGSEAVGLVAAIEDERTRRAVEVERALLAVTGAGCRSALGALAVPSGDGMSLTGFVQDERGPRRAQVHGRGDDLVGALVEELGL